MGKTPWIRRFKVKLCTQKERLHIMQLFGILSWLGYQLILAKNSINEGELSVSNQRLSSHEQKNQHKVLDVRGPPW
jgi:hypothetical protein